MAAHRVAAVLAGVIPDEQDGVEPGGDPLHHRERTRKAADDAHVRREIVDEQVLGVAVRVGDDELGGARRPGGRDGCFDLARHPLACLAVLETGRPELRGLHHARDPFHVG